MPLNYRRPGVYLEESLLSSAGDVSNATSVAVFVGAASKGPVNEPTRIETWGDYATLFGGFDTVNDPQTNKKALSYLPYSVYSYFQNGGRTAFVVRAIPVANAGTAASRTVTGSKFSDATSSTAFTISARSAGKWGTNVSYTLRIQETVGASPVTDVVFTLQVILTTNGVQEVVESYPNLCVAGTISGTRPVAEAINDAVSGSRYITISGASTSVAPAEATTPVALQGGTDPRLPTSGDLATSAIDAVGRVEGPVLLNIAGYISDADTVETTTWADNYVGATVASSSWSDRQDVFIINDNCPPREPGQTTSSYKTSMQQSTALAANSGDSYSASYGPWGLITNPLRVGSIMAIPPGGAVMGMISRVDSTIGVFRAPAGVIASLNNFVGVQTKFTDTELGDLNSANINIIRPVVGSGLSVMGARTRKSYGADRYVSARRTLIYIREVMRRSTQFAVFENNDSRLWSSMSMAAERILRPLWESGGLRGASASEAYFIRCDETVNTPAVIAAGEVRMEVGVALEYPAEFVIIRVSQFDRGQTTTEVNPR
ncbi:MAG: hypothetical protein EBR40_09980 [Proteobacteria bacterium]|nr:hypothetical protein [Pseudomonadota bacterium]